MAFTRSSLCGVIVTESHEKAERSLLYITGKNESVSAVCAVCDIR